VSDQRTSNLIIFGFTGDLSKRKLFPALYHLMLDGLLDKHFEIIATTRRDVDLEKFKKELKGFIEDNNDNKCDDLVLDNLISNVKLLRMDVSNPDDFNILQKTLETQDVACSVGHTRLFYFAVPPIMFSGIISSMVGVGLHKSSDAPNRLLIEKPFGHNLQSAQELCDLMGMHFEEDSIYRIDHYLAKDTVQNLLHVRFFNMIFRQVWNQESIESIVITAIESIDIQGRSGFYEHTGALRDMIQSHLLQVLALVTMEQPKDFEVESVREKRLKALKGLRLVDIGTAKRGQYQGYRFEVGNPESVVETYAELNVRLMSDEWSGSMDLPPVAFKLRAGKALDHKEASIVITFRDHSIPNILIITMQPEEGFHLKIATRKPGLDNNQTEMINLSYHYDQTEEEKHEAYEKILLDVIKGDQTLFPSSEEVLTNWRLIEPVLKYWRDNSHGLAFYEKGSSLPIK